MTNSKGHGILKNPRIYLVFSLVSIYLSLPSIYLLLLRLNQTKCLKAQVFNCDDDLFVNQLIGCLRSHVDVSTIKFVLVVYLLL